MKFARPALALTIALAALPLAGCAVDATDIDAAEDEIEIDLGVEEPSLGPESWTVGSIASSPMWDSGKTANLSDWKYVKCDDEYGSDYMLTGLNVWKENTGNLDNFIGRMSGVCSEYNLTSSSALQTGTTATKNIFSSTHYRSGLLGIDIPTSDSYPIGVELEVNSTDGYVKDIRLGYAHKTATGLAIDSDDWFVTDWATGYGGYNRYLWCGDHEVMTGMQLKYDTSKGKIRKIQIFCRTLSYAPIAPW